MHNERPNKTVKEQIMKSKEQQPVKPKNFSLVSPFSHKNPAFPKKIVNWPIFTIYILLTATPI